MNALDDLWSRLGVIIDILKVHKKPLGRTAIMKLLYLLQTLKGMPIGYRFTLYTYGPFDSNVLSDIDYAATIGVLKVDLEYFLNGYAYNIELGDAVEEILEFIPDLSLYHEDVAQIVGHFGPFSARDLELISTIVFVDQSFHQKGREATLEEIESQVGKIKPKIRQQEGLIMRRIEQLRDLGILKSIDQ